LAGFRPVNLDRMRPFRIVATALFVVWGIIAAVQSRFWLFLNALKVWSYVLMVFSVGMLVLGLSERTDYGVYLQKRLSRSRVARILGYPFRTGQLNAVCWALLLLAIGIASSYVIFAGAETFWVGGEKTNAGNPVRVFALNISGYALTTLVVWRYILRFESTPGASLWWVTGTVIVLITAILSPMCVGGVDGINYFAGYLFAQKSAIVLPRLYGWNALALLLLIPAYFGFPRKGK
jgi:hypothetical protein